MHLNCSLSNIRLNCLLISCVRLYCLGTHKKLVNNLGVYSKPWLQYNLERYVILPNEWPCNMICIIRVLLLILNKSIRSISMNARVLTIS